MYKPKDHGMKCLPLKMIRIFGRSVNLISKKWMSLTCHMDPDLVGTSCLQAALHISSISKALQYLVMGRCIFAVFVINGHFLTVYRMTPDRTFDPACIFFKIATDNGSVPSFNCVLLQLLCKVFMGNIIFTYKNRSCGIHIDPVDDPRPHHTIDPGKMALTVV